MLTLFIPVIENEVGRLGILFQSLKYFMEPKGMKILILTPFSHLIEVSKAVKRFSMTNIPITFLTDEKVYSYDRGNTIGWHRQQALKLLIVPYIDTEFYLIFDCDVFATKQFSIFDLIKDGKGIIDLQTSPSTFEDIERSAEILGVNYSPEKRAEVMKVTPAVLNTEIVRNILQTLQNRHCNGDHQQLPEYLYKSISNSRMNEEGKCKFVTEYMLYYVYALCSEDLWRKHFRGILTCDNNVWYVEQCFDWDPQKSFSDGSLFCVYQGNFNVPVSIVFDQVRDYIGAPRISDVPKISCLMVTKNRLSFVKTAVKCFQKQTYPNKELVVVCDALDGVKEYVENMNDRRIVLFQLSPSSKTLGELRNFSIDQSSGNLVTQWDDDDWYHPSRLSIQYNRLRDQNVDVCLLSQWLMVWPGVGMYAISNIRADGWEGTMLAKKSIVPRYSKLRKSEDTEMMKRLANITQVHVITDPDYYFLYIYLIHGKNTWDKEHFRVMFNYATPVDKKWPDSLEKLSEKLSELVGIKYKGYTYYTPCLNFGGISWLPSWRVLAVLLVLFVLTSYLLLR